MLYFLVDSLASSLFSDSSDDDKTPKPKKEKMKLKQFLPQTPTSITKTNIKEASSSPKKVKTDISVTSSPKKKQVYTPVGKLKEQHSDGPQCLKCEVICKDTTHLKNHLLSHFYTEFYVLLPGSKPYPCPICEKESRDRITLLRHYAFAHNKTYEVTGIDFSTLGGRGGPVRRRKAPEAGTPNRSDSKTPTTKRSPSKVKTTEKKVELSKAIIENDSDSSDDEEMNKLLERANQRLAGKIIFLNIT